MGSLLERLEAREQAARTRVEALRAEMDRLAEHLAAEQERLRRLEITKETVIEVLAGGDDDGEVGVVVDPEAGVGAAALGAAGQVPVFGQDGDGRRLPVAYRDVVEVLADAGPLRARQVCQAVGTGVEPGIGRGCGSSSSGWSSVAGWSRPSRGCSPVLAGWLRR
jgi:plasmid stabilization system protein ParE